MRLPWGCMQAKPLGAGMTPAFAFVFALGRHTQVGQCGNQIGCRFWDMALKEHAADPERWKEALINSLDE